MSGSSAEQRRNELERKKLKLAEMREQKRRTEEERKRQLLNAPHENGERAPGRATLSNDELTEILSGVGIEPEPNIKTSPAKNDGLALENGVGSPRGAQMVSSSAARLIALDYTQPLTVSTAPRDNACYSKNTQTDDDRYPVGEFSTGSQEFDFDDDMLPLDKHSVHVDGSPTDDLAAYLPYPFATRNTSVGHAEEEKKGAEEEEKPLVKLPPLSEEEKNQILSSAPFLNFFDYAGKVMMRAIAEDDIFVNYSADNKQDVTVSGERLTESRAFFDQKWTAGRAVVDFSFSEIHPELLAVAYDQLPEAPAEPDGVVVVWNTKFKRPLPEYVFYCYSRLTSVAFARFHPHLIIGGCYSGQLVLWDNRLGTTKKTPCNKSPLSVSAHTHPVYSLAVVGSANAHSVVSVSTDGKLCAWNIETLAQPVEGKELIGKPTKPPVAVLCMAFPPNDVNNLIVAGEDGAAYFISRHGNTPADKIFEGHYGPVSGASFHPANGPIDFSHIFLTASLDWTVKLWSLKEAKLRLSLEAHTDYVYDVAWSPAHPAVFASIDTLGNLFLWNLNEDTEGPAARILIGDEESPVFLRKVVWSANGQQLFVGDSNGQVLMYEVHESMHTNIRADEWSKLASILSDVKQTVEEMEEQEENEATRMAPAASSSSRGLYPSSATSSRGQSTGGSTTAALVTGSPRAVF